VSIPGGKKKSAKLKKLKKVVEVDSDSVRIDKEKVLSNPMLKNAPIRDLVPIDLTHGYFKDDPEKRVYEILIDVENYQRGRSSKVDEIVSVLKAGGFLPDTKTVVLRPKTEVLAINDGGQSWRALVEARDKMQSDMCFLTVRFHKFDSIPLEAKLFCVLNNVAAVYQEVQIRAHSGETATLLKQLNSSKESLLHGKIWTQVGSVPTRGVSAVSLVRAAATLLFAADDKAVMDWSEGAPGAEVLMRTQQVGIPDILPSLDPILKDEECRNIAKTFFERLGTVCFEPIVLKKGQKPYDMGRPNFVVCQALALMQRQGLLTRAEAAQLGGQRLRTLLHGFSKTLPPDRKSKLHANFRRRIIVRTASNMRRELDAVMR
jgi:hypothetical protein